MYDSTKIKQQDVPITLDYILSKVTEYDIYARYIGQFKIGYIYNSPFRKDKNPSFGIFKSRKSGKLLFKDHGNGECGDVIKFVELYTGLTNYNDILNRIIADMSITNNTKLKSTKHYESKDTVIGIVRQDWTDFDKQYWSQFGITKETLTKFNVSSIKYYLCDGIVKGIYKDENPMYAYKVYDHFKVYRPLADKYTKWRNNLTPYDIQGYEQLPEKGDLLIITKSLKDVMCLYEMGYTAISPSSESTFIPDKALNQLKKRFKRILICFDRDGPGVKYMRKISLKTGLKGFLVHKKWKAKDISDAIKLNGFEVIKNWLKETL
nr:MAG TPA: DNA primase [Caudoviricetes sp.]